MSESKSSTATPSVVERIYARCARTETGCLQWSGATNTPGHYGYISVGGNAKRVHRIVYASVYGEIPAGQVLDHTCRNRICVELSHLECVTQGENVRRGVEARAAERAGGGKQ